MTGNTLPDLQKQKFSREHVLLEHQGRLYVMLDWPTRVYGPAFERLGQTCVAAYLIPVTPSHVPSGLAKLAVWSNMHAFETNTESLVLLNPMSLVSQTESKQVIHEKVEQYKRHKERLQNDADYPSYLKDKILELSHKVDSLIEIANSCETAGIDMTPFCAENNDFRIGFLRRNRQIVSIGIETGENDTKGLYVNKDGAFAWTANGLEKTEPAAEHMSRFLVHWAEFEEHAYEYIADCIAEGLK